MTIFLAVSALMNIALGYGLAIYLGRAATPLDSEHGDEHGIDSYAEPFESHVPAPLAPMSPAPAVAPVAPVAPMAPAELAAAPMPEPAPAAAAAELETDVLAGIEEFRNQLAQMKAQPAGADAAAPAEATPAKPALETAGA